MWLRGARGDSALLVGGGVEQDPAQDPGEFVTEGVRAPTSPITAIPFSHAVPHQCAYRPADVARREDGGRDDGGWWVSLGHKGDVRGDVCVEREGGEGGCKVGCGGLSN